MKTKRSTTARELRCRLAALLRRLAADVEAGRFGQNGTSLNREGYTLEDVLSNESDPYEPQ
ncbi:MAG: hypothetical protein HW378_220 [Anaerolineales bacterium]|nr:hypothetical protein [Anaerolineales bacterium]